MAATRIGLIVPSSNTTMETEIPEMLRRRSELHPDERYTFHSSRMRMKKVTPEELAAMNAQSTRCVAELVDAEVDALAYACLVAIMSQGETAYLTEQERIEKAVAENGSTAAVVTSAGALISGLQALGARRVGLIAPYVPSLTDTVVSCITSAEIDVVAKVSLSVADNLEVGRLDPENLRAVAAELDLAGCDALVLSACVQMPSLPVLAEIEKMVDLPTISAASATVFELLRGLGRTAEVPDAGHLLSGAVQVPTPSS
jgi:maleate isomerase